MKTILFLSKADWAGSNYFAASAINSVGRIKCRQLTFYPHIYEYLQDLVIPKCYVKGPTLYSEEEVKEALKITEEADLIHIWNDETQNFAGIWNFSAEKVKSYTFSGSYYRRDHQRINERLKQLRARVVVQNPTYCFPEEMESEFIPHAIDLSRFDAMLPKQEGTVGCYAPTHGNTSAQADIILLEEVLKGNFPGWHLVLREKSSWKDRMNGLSKCALYFEYMDQNMGYIGRSALEACAFGVPVMSCISEKALQFGGERIGDPGIFNVTKENLKERLEVLINQPSIRWLAGLKARQWVEEHYSYSVVGEFYTRFFEELM